MMHHALEEIFDDGSMVIIPDLIDNDEYISIILSQNLLKDKRLCPAINAPYEETSSGQLNPESAKKRRAMEDEDQTPRPPKRIRDLIDAKQPELRADFKVDMMQSFVSILIMAHTNTYAPTALALPSVTYREYLVPGNTWTSWEQVT